MIFKNKLINGEHQDTVANQRKICTKVLDFKGPITRYYNWPSLYEKPMAHQIITADFLLRYRRGYCFNAIGTGKTLCMDWMIDFLSQEKEIKRAIIVAPLSTLVSVHGEELEWSLPHLDYTILYGSKQKRLERLKQDRQVYIINYDGLKVIADEIYARKDIDCIFIDELAILRNRHITSKKAMRAVGEDHKNPTLWQTVNGLFGAHLPDKLVWGFTGSPMPKSPMDCYGQARLINPDNLPQQVIKGRQVPISFSRFREMVATKHGDWHWEPVYNWEEICYGILQPAIRFAREDCFDLPECVTQTLNAEMSKEQIKMYKDMMRQLFIETQKGTVIDAVNEGVKLNKLTQIACGVIYDGEGNIHKINYQKRLAVLKHQIDSVPASLPNSHIIIFVPFRHIARILTRELEKIYGEVGLVESRVSDGKRNKIYSQFKHGNLRFIVAIPSCMSHGLNLQHKCSTVIWWAPIDRYDIYEQACGRIIRAGQKFKQLIIHLQGSPVEKEMYRKLKKKENAQRILLDLLKYNMSDVEEFRVMRNWNKAQDRKEAL